MFALLAESIHETLTENGGSMTYPDLLETIDPMQRRSLPAALAHGKANELFVQTVAWDKATSTLAHNVSLVGE